MVESRSAKVESWRFTPMAMSFAPDTSSAGPRFASNLDDNQTIFPGLVDLHAHYAIDLFGAGRVEETEAYPELFLANGVTTTFPAGELDPERMRELRLAIERGDRTGPRILNSGPYFGSWRPGWDNSRDHRRFDSAGGGSLGLTGCGGIQGQEHSRRSSDRVD